MSLGRTFADGGRVGMRVAGAFASAVYLGGLVYIFPAPYDVFERGLVERRVFAAVCTVAWIALQVALALPAGARPGRRLAVSSSIACLPWALAAARALRASVGLKDLAPVEPALLATSALLSLQALAFALLASAMLLAQVALSLEMKGRWSKGVSLVLACAVIPSSAYVTWELGLAWMAAPLWVAAFALLRPYPSPSGSAGSLDSRGAAVLLGLCFTLALGATHSDECGALVSMLAQPDHSMTAPSWPHPGVLAAAWLPTVITLVADRKESVASAPQLAPAVLIAALTLGHAALFVHLRTAVHDTSWLPTRDGFAWVSLEEARPAGAMASFIGVDDVPSRHDWRAPAIIDGRVSWEQLRVQLESATSTGVDRIYLAGRQTRRSPADPVVSICRSLDAAALPHLAQIEVGLSTSPTRHVSISSSPSCRRIDAERIAVATSAGEIVVAEHTPFGIRPQPDVRFEPIVQHAQRLLQCGLAPVLIVGTNDDARAPSVESLGE